MEFVGWSHPISTPIAGVTLRVMCAAYEANRPITVVIYRVV